VPPPSKVPRQRETAAKLPISVWSNLPLSYLYSWMRVPHNVPADRIHLYRHFERILMAAKQLTKSEILNSISATTELSRKQVASVVDALGELAKKNVGKKGPGVFVLSGLLKIVAIQKPAVPAHKGINPFTKQEQMFKAKPARKVIKVRALKALKDAVK
jgi:nucleoid DNA-binding protein